MYGHIRNSGIRVLTRYEEALHRLTRTKPIAGKGVNAGVVPLGHRNRTLYQLRMRQDESIACRLYRTDVVVFDKDGTITIDPAGYSTISTANFISEVLGVSASQTNNRLIINVADGYYQAEGLKLRPLDAWSHRYEVVECKQDVVHGLDRKMMNALRRDTQEFRKFLSGLMKIKDYTLTDEELAEVNIKDNGSLALDSLWRHDAKVVTERHTKFNEMVKSGDAENWHSAAMWLCASARYTMWDRKFNPQNVVKLLDDILIALNPTVLVPKVLDAGVTKRDSYARFKPFMEKNT
jgi:hypothetical protein